MFITSNQHMKTIEQTIDENGLTQQEWDSTPAAVQRILRRETLTQEEIQSRIYRGELEATDADGVVTMRDLA